MPLEIKYDAGDKSENRWKSMFVGCWLSLVVRQVERSCRGDQTTVVDGARLSRACAPQ